jgi:DNA polymerase-3 subunit beta
LKFKTTSKEIKEFVLSVSRAVDIKPSNPSLQGIYLRVVGGFCELIGTDLDLVIKAKFPVEEMVEGESLINSRVFSEVVRKLPVGNVVFLRFRQRGKDRNRKKQNIN